MAIQHKFNPSDRRALSVYSVMDQVHQFQMMALGFKVLLALVGDNYAWHRRSGADEYHAGVARSA
jgi:hypothetical protein